MNIEKKTVRKVGVIVPATNCVLEHDLWKMRPNELIFLSTRVGGPGMGITRETLEGLAAEVPAAAQKLSAAEVEVILYGCTSGSFLNGPEFEKELSESVERDTGVKLITTTRAVVNALEYAGVNRIAVAAPYSGGINDRMDIFFQEMGLEVVKISAMEKVDPKEVHNVPQQKLIDFACGAMTDEAKGLFISCTDFPAVNAVERIEKRINKPVITSNQASLWAVMRYIGIKPQIEGYGMLLNGESIKGKGA